MTNLLGNVDDDCPCWRYELHPIFRKQCQASLKVFVLLPAGPEHPPDDDDGAEGDGHEGLGRPEGAPQSVEGGPSGLGPAYIEINYKMHSHINFSLRKFKI